MVKKMPNTVRERVMAIISEILSESRRLPETGIAYDQTLAGDFGMDSLDITKMLIELEYEFDIKIPTEVGDTWGILDSESGATVEDVCSYMEANCIQS